MGDNADHFESFEPHTLLKHGIYRAYLERWARILLVKPDPRRKRVRVVDACAGCGEDSAGNPGSPLIAVREADQAAEQIRAIRKEAVHVEVVAIEQDPQNYRQLAVRMEGMNQHRVVHGTLADVIGELEPSFATIPHLFFVDPFGLEPLQASVVRRALAGPRNEVFLLFADQAALRHIGAVAALDRTAQPEQTLFDALDPEERLPPPQPSASLEITAAHAIRILDAAFGEFDWRSIQRLPKEKRREAVLNLYESLLKDMGATHVIRLPVVGFGGNLKYHLMHASRSGKAFATMKDAIERGWAKSVLDGGSVELMRLVSSSSIEHIEAQTRRHFAGRRVAWSSENADERVAQWLDENTDAFPSQRRELKKRLRSLITRENGFEEVVFPELQTPAS